MSDFNLPALPQRITLAGGCFWCLDAAYRPLRGVLRVECGYSNGTTLRPSYREVCTGQTGHAEVIRLDFDPDVLSLDTVLDVFFAMHDPTTLNRQGNDIGTQYRSGIYTFSEAQQHEAEAAKASYGPALRAKGYGPITTEILPAPEFFYAEDYHQQYLDKNPQGYCGLGGTGIACQIGTGIAAE